MKGRSFLAYSIVISLLEQVVLLVVLLWVLPQFGIVVPLWLVISAAVALAAVSIVLTRLNIRTLALKVLHSPGIGTYGRVVTPLAPRGYVRIGNELWPAVAEGEALSEGQRVRVLRMKYLRLIVEAVNGEELDS